MRIIKETIKGFKTVFKDKFYLRIAVLASVLIGYLYYWLLSQTTSLSAFFQMASNGDYGPYSYLYAFVYWVLTIATVVSFGASVSFLIWLWRHSKLAKLTGGSNAMGAFVGALGSACPVCGAFLLSSLGVAGGLSIFPLQGLELKLLSFAFIGGSTVFAARKVNRAENCEDCSDISKHSQHASLEKVSPKKTKEVIVLPLDKILVGILTFLFIINQILISQTAALTGLPSGSVGKLLGIKSVSAKTIIAPKLNPDGKTTSLVEQPTISEVSANPKSGDPLADAKVVMLATGQPFYAPEDISFDDPINAQKKWGAFEQSIKLTKEQETRYQKLISTFTCNYCCGGPNNVTINKQCGCAHARAARGFFKYMVQNFGDKYTDEEMMGEGFRWQAIWYPKGALEDYLLATGNGDVLPHQTHGGAGTNGRHGL